MTTHATPTEAGAPLVHLALFYETLDEYVEGVAAFLAEGLAAGESALVAVPGPKLDALRAATDGALDPVAFVDMRELGRNPGRIISAVRRFTDANAQGRTRFVGEPIWPGRSAAEVREATRHEALLNLAFSDVATTILCPYDVRGLSGDVIADAHRTHPELLHEDGIRASHGYVDPVAVFIGTGSALAPVPAGADRFDYDESSLSGLRHFVTERVGARGLGDGAAQDLVIAVCEVASNTVRHAASPGRLSMWSTVDELVCELADAGHIRDPLVGRVLPPANEQGGRGLWLANHLCDLVEIHSSVDGTTVRLHMRLGAP